jgi:hypothetical protein
MQMRPVAGKGRGREGRGSVWDREGSEGYSCHSSLKARQHLSPTMLLNLSVSNRTRW